MPSHGRLPAFARLLRLTAMLSLIVGCAAVATIVNGQPAAKSQALVAVAILLGFAALLGAALLALPYVYRKKEKNDPRP